MAFIDFTVDELAEDLRIEDSVIAYAEVQQGIQRHNRMAQSYNRVRLGLQTSPENFFYNEGQWTGMPYVNLNALEFTMTTGTAKDGAYGAVDGGSPCTELFSIIAGTENDSVADTFDEVTGELTLAVNLELLEQVEVREGDTYSTCAADGTIANTTVRQTHLSLKSSNKPDFTFYEWHPQAKYRFNRQCNWLTASNASQEGQAVAYMGDNNYVVTSDVMDAIIAVVTA
jgi:hypothetical protein